MTNGYFRVMFYSVTLLVLRPVTVHTYGLFLDVVRCYATFCYTYTSLSDPVLGKLQELIYYAYSSSSCDVVTFTLCCSSIHTSLSDPVLVKL